MNNKREKFYLILLCLYIFIIILCSFSDYVLNYINISFTYLLSFIFKDVALISIITNYIVLGIIYIGLGIISCVYFINHFDNLKDIIIFSILIPMAVIVLSMIIMSFYSNVNILLYGIRLIYVIIGFTIVYISTLNKIKKLNKKEGEREK